MRQEAYQMRHTKTVSKSRAYDKLEKYQSDKAREAFKRKSYQMEVANGD